MYRYYFKMLDGSEYCFLSKYYITKAKVTIMYNATVLNFEDAGMAVNLANAKELRINGRKYRLKAYQV